MVMAYGNLDVLVECSTAAVAHLMQPVPIQLRFLLARISAPHLHECCNGFC